MTGASPGTPARPGREQPLRRVDVLPCDGSARFVKDFINLLSGMQIRTKAGGEVVDANSL